MLHACIVCTCTLAQLLKLVKHLPKAVMIRGDANGVVHIRMVRVIASFSHFIALGHEVRFFFKRGGRIDCNWQVAFLSFTVVPMAAINHKLQSSKSTTCASNGEFWIDYYNQLQYLRRLHIWHQNF